MATAPNPAASRVPVLDLFPELAAGLSADQARVARQQVRAPAFALEPGPWRPLAQLQGGGGQLGLLIVDGLLSREVVLGGTVATELVGRGDVLRPGEHDGAAAPVPFDVEWRVLHAARIALLDRDFALAIGHWPELMEAVVSRAVRRSMSLALHLAVSHLRRVDTRLLVLMWHLADRWGKVRSDGVSVPLKLTHQMLGQLVGAQRPSVTTALKLLASDGRLTRSADGTWILHGDPPDTLSQLATSGRAAG